MKKIIRNLVLSIPFLTRKLNEYTISRKFKTEIDLLNNRSKVNSSQPSIIHFSVNKAATQHVKKVLKEISVENGLKPASIHDYAFNAKLPYLDSLTFNQMEKYKHIFKETGYLYSVFGGMIENIDNLNNYKIILSIRDPRDILVSNYYSTAYSHTIPPVSSDKRDLFLSKREWAKSVNIDEFVIREADDLYEVFDRYKSNLCPYKIVGIAKYEKMISNYREWLTDLTDIAGLKMSTMLVEKLLEENKNKKPKEENKLIHNRKGVSGDFRDKLKNDTIDILNSKFEPILLFFNYSI